MKRRSIACGPRALSWWWACQHDAPLPILGEPSATLDGRAGHEVFPRFAELRRAVLVSHRFSTIRMADRIPVPADGSMKEQGTHEQPLSRGGRQAELLELQAAGYR